MEQKINNKTVLQDKLINFYNTKKFFIYIFVSILLAIIISTYYINNKNHKIIEKLVKNKIPVMGHIGYTPQFKKNFKIEGDTLSKKNKLLKEALEIEKAGAFSIVLECISPETSKLITSN